MFKFISQSCHPTIILLLLLSKSSNYASAVCNACSETTNLACVSETQFQVCVDSIPTGTATTCPSGYICSTNSTSICEPDTNTNIVGDCTECNTCDENKTFACTGVRTYALCLGTTTISDLGGTCAPYHVCSIDYEYICGNATLGIEPTCPTADEIATTTVATTSTTSSNSEIVTDPVAYCQNIQINGRFPVGNDLITTCKQYVYCFINANVWSGALYYCPGATYFDSSSRYCTPNVPARCVTSTQSLYLKSFELSFDD